MSGRPGELFDEEGEVDHGQAAANHLSEAASDVLAFTGFPTEHWRQIWSNNPRERLNKELRRRTDVVRARSVGH